LANITLIIDPPDHGRYLAHLNACFPGWGDLRLYSWAYERVVGAPEPQRLIFTDDTGAWIAGSGVVYRQIQIGSKRTLAGIMTGSWTMPVARGRGLFSRFIEESRTRVREHGGAVLLAFVTETNASCRRLEAAGSRMVPTWYAVGDSELALETAPVEEVQATDDVVAELFERRRVRVTAASAAFAYGESLMYAGQFLTRSASTIVLRGGSDLCAVIEVTGDTDRLLFLDEGAQDRAGAISMLSARAARKGRKFFAFGIGEQPRRELSDAGLRLNPGYLTVLPSSESGTDEAVAQFLVTATWEMQAGDRM
jgi:hypothetical protein